MIADCVVAYLPGTDPGTGDPDPLVSSQVRKGYHDGGDNTHTWLPRAASWGAAAATVHGRTRQQR